MGQVEDEGRVLIAQSDGPPEGAGSNCSHIVLMVVPRSTMQYVTWMVGKDGSTFHGHYKSNMYDAWTDFMQRSLKLGHVSGDPVEHFGRFIEAWVEGMA